VREYKSSDFAQLKRIHDRAGVEYDFNVLRFPDRLVAEDSGRVIAALIGRPSEETDLLLDKDFGNPRDRWNVAMHLISMGEIRLREMGVRTAHCYVPREIVKSYGKRLRSIGFLEEVGATFRKEIW
jgi:hypothetical protein